MKRKDSILANFYYQSLPKAKEGGNYFNKYKVPTNDEVTVRVDPILKFFDGGFMMPANEGGNINFPTEKGFTPERMAYGGDISIPDLGANNWVAKYNPKNLIPKANEGLEVNQQPCPPNHVRVNGQCVSIYSDTYRKAYNQGLTGFGTASNPDYITSNRVQTLPPIVIKTKALSPAERLRRLSAKFPQQRNPSESVAFGAANPQYRNILNTQMNQYMAQNQVIENIMKERNIPRENAELMYHAMTHPNTATLRPAQEYPWYEKAWDVASNPMTALTYKVKGQDIPDHFTRGESNKLDFAVNILNPATYINAGANTVKNIANPISTTSRLYKGTRDLLANAVGDNAGWGNVLDAAGIVGDAATIVPISRGINAASKELKPFVQGTKNTWNLTADLPFKTRLQNALRSGSLQYDLPGIDRSEYMHHVFSPTMSADDALREIARQKAAAPIGAKMGDTNMSLNSTPLYFQSATRGAGEFPVVRTGEFQSLNNWGFKGKKISQSIPSRVYRDYPEIIDRYNNQVNALNLERQMRLDRVANDASLSNADRLRLTDEANALYKRDMGNIIPEREALDFINAEPGLFQEFASAYKPHMDAPITTLSQRTGLNFPGTRYRMGSYGSLWEAPTAISVKGSFAPRYKGIANQALNKGLEKAGINVKYGSNQADINAFDQGLRDIDSYYFDNTQRLQNAFNRGEISDDLLQRGLDQFELNRNSMIDDFYRNNPAGHLFLQEKTFQITAPHLAYPGVINTKSPDRSLDQRFMYGPLKSGFKSLLNFNVNPPNMRGLKRYGGESWLNKYPTGGPVQSAAVPAPAPTPQTGAPMQYGPTFSDQRGYTPPESAADKRRDFLLNLLKLGTFMGGVAGGLSKRPDKKQQNPSNQNNVFNLDVDGNGKPLSEEQKMQKGITWNYNPNIESQKIKDPFAPRDPFQEQYEQGLGSSMSMARRGGDVSIYGRRNYKSDTPSFFKGGGTNWLARYDNGGGPGDGEKKTLLKDKQVGVISTPIKQLDLRPTFPSGYYNEIEVADPNCPDPTGVGCSYQATREAMKITGLPYNSYAPANAAYRDAVAERYGLQNIFTQEGEQKRYANSGNKGWKYPSAQDFSSWKAGDIVVLDAPGIDIFSYNAPPGFTEKDNSGASHNGVVVGFTKEGRPIIRHGYATGTKGKGKQITEVLGKDNRVTSLGHGRYAVKSVWRPKEVTDDGTIESIKPIVDKGSNQAARKEATYYPASFSLKPTYEEKLMNELPVAAAFSGADTRLNTKSNLVSLFNNTQLDKELQYQLGITSRDLQNLKPVVYGIAGQETNFNDVDSPLASLKDVPGNITNTGNSKGLFQIKYGSLTEDERKMLDIQSPNDLLDDKKAYKAAILLMHNAKKRMDAEVEEGTHPGLKNADPFFRAAYYYNQPARAISTAADWAKGSNPVVPYDPTTWLNSLVTRERPNVFRSINPYYVKKIELRMDKGSYPYKLMQKANDLQMDYDYNQIENLEEVVVRGTKKGSKIKLYN